MVGWVLLMGHARHNHWLGSPLTIGAARALCPDNRATTLQVAAGVMAGVVWAMRNPDLGEVWATCAGRSATGNPWLAAVVCLSSRKTARTPGPSSTSA